MLKLPPLMRRSRLPVAALSSRSLVPLASFIDEKPCAVAHTAESISPAPDPRSLRRHYPHQVQGVSSITPDSQPLRLPRSLLLAQNRTRASEVNDEQNCRPSVMDGLQTWNAI